MPSPQHATGNAPSPVAAPVGGAPARQPDALFSPRELADLLLEAGGAEIRAAFACGLVTGLVPVVLVALQSETLARLDRIAYTVAAGLLLLALTAGLATFLDGATVRIAGGLASAGRGLGRHSRRLIGRGARRLVTWSLASPSQRTAAARLTTPHGVMAIESTGSPDRGTITATIRAASAVARWAGRAAPMLPQPSLRERRVFAKSVAAQCATIFVLLGAATAAVGWLR